MSWYGAIVECAPQFVSCELCDLVKRRFINPIRCQKQREECENKKRGFTCDDISLSLILKSVSETCGAFTGVRCMLFLTTEPLVLYVFYLPLHSGTVSVRTLQHCGGVCLCMCECGTGFFLCVCAWVMVRWWWLIADLCVYESVSKRERGRDQPAVYIMSYKKDFSSRRNTAV